MKNVNYILLNWILTADSPDLPEDSPEPKIDFAVGGQAVIEGVMMRSPNNITIAVRKKNGDIRIKNKPYKTLVQRHKFLNIPIVRGVVNLFEMMVVGTGAINFSANQMVEDEMTVEELKKYKNKKKTPLIRLIEAIMFAFSIVSALALSIFLFKFVPLWLTTFLQDYFPLIQENYIFFNIIDGIIKTLMFISYIYIIGLFPSFKRVFEYHGAEHKSIFNYESKKDLTVENASKQSRFHPRCGTSFIMIVFAISILVYTLLPKQPDFWSNLALRLAFLPLIAGISYEYLKLSAKHAENAFVKAVIAPGLWFQRLTTKEPDQKQLSVGLKSLQEALRMER